MREIKFRAWDVKREHYFQPNKFDFENKNDGLPWVHDGSKFITDVILEQFTGLHDKNGKEIYEGDILAYQFDGQRHFTNAVKWKTEYGFYIAGITVGEWEPEDILYAEYEISGNIHENPELLEE